ncbi:hypothetical protein MKX01_039879 [Papaver californicum]|nr:hypothetical protein MKX01_039879 [Papaver californicum]
MDSESANSSSSPPVKDPVTQTPVVSSEDSSSRDTPSLLSASGISSWAKSLKLPQPLEEETGNAGKSTFSRFTSGFGLLSPKDPVPNESAEGTSTTTETGVLGSFTKGLVDTSRNAVKAVQVKARHMVSQNKRRYQEGGFDLDMTYITENIIAMGFPAGDMSSGLFGYFEGLYRNHMEEVIKFFETHHKGKYKVYNLCSERLYDAALFEGKVASFPFDDHNCPPIHLIKAFCQSAYSWLKEDIENVVVVHCKAGMARTGLMITSLLLFLKFFPTAEESIDYYNQKRCIDGKGLVLPSQIRYVKYFERILTHFNGENQPGRRCMLRGFRLYRCPYWIRPSITISDHNGVLFSTKTHARTKELMPEEFWFSSPKKGIMVFALPGEPGLTELNGDFKIHFHDRQGDFYCWLNTTMTENRKVLKTSDLDGFDKRKLPSPGFQVEIVMIDYDGTIPTKNKTEVATNKESPTGGSSGTTATTGDQSAPASKPNKDYKNQEKDDVFSDTESEGSVSSKKRHGQMSSSAGTATTATNDPKSGVAPEEMADVTRRTEHVSLGNDGHVQNPTSEVKHDGTGAASSIDSSDFKAIAADASFFSFGDDEDYESE